MFRCKNKQNRKILYALYYSWENNRFGNEQTWKCQGERISRQGSVRKSEAHFCLLLSSIHVSGHIFETRKRSKGNVWNEPSNVSKAHCKNLPFFHMTPCLSFVQYTRLYSVLHTSQINVQWTSLSTGDVALCPDNLRPIKQTPTDDTDWLLLTWF